MGWRTDITLELSMAECWALIDELDGIRPTEKARKDALKRAKTKLRGRFLLEGRRPRHRAFMAARDGK